SDKNTIMQIAAEKIRELQSSQEELRKQNSELEAILAARRDEEVVEGAKIRFRVGNPSSGIDSMLSVLKCLKETGSETRAIQSSFSAQELSAVIEVQNKFGKYDQKRKSLGGPDHHGSYHGQIVATW
ncbi:hypothetical protein RJ640_021998, partial [Escallonia rubra]